MAPSLLAHRRLYLCVGLRDDLDRLVAEAIAGGVDVVQLREKNAEAIPIMRAAAKISAICREGGVPFFINDRIDIALAVGADGVHLGQGDLPPDIARRFGGDKILIGRSTHAPAEILAAVNEPVDYVSAGPVEPTPTKPGREGTGLEYVTMAVNATTLPVFITGGVTPEKIAPLAKAGASHFVVVRNITEAADPRRAAHRLREAINANVQGG